MKRRDDLFTPLGELYTWPKQLLRSMNTPDRAAMNQSVHKEIRDAMIAAGVVAYVDWKDRRKTDPALSRSDLAIGVYEAMRRAIRHDRLKKIAV